MKSARRDAEELRLKLATGGENGAGSGENNVREINGVQVLGSRGQ
ncbi:MAG: hypothetical protein WKF84_26615 [Pyrinomonadaceae bacterium]